MSRYFICPNCNRKMLLTGQSDVPMSCPKCKAQFDTPPEVVDTGTSKGRVETRNNKGQFQKRTPDNNKEADASISVGKPQIKININRADPSSKKKEEKEETIPEYEQEKPEPVILEDNQPSNDELMAELERLRKENAEFREKAESKKTKSETLDAALSSEEMLDQLTGGSSDLYEQSEIDELEAFLNETPTQTAKPKAPVSKSVMSKISEKITSVKEETEESSEKIVPPSPFPPKKSNKEATDEDVSEKAEDIKEKEDVEEAEIPKKKEPVKRPSLSERMDIYYEEDEAEEDNDAEPSYNTDEIEELPDEEIDDDDSLESGDDEEGYNPNYDKYYDDILPELLAEKDRIPKESIIRAVVMIVTVIIAAFVAAYRIV